MKNNQQSKRDILIIVSIVFLILISFIYIFLRDKKIDESIEYNKHYLNLTFEQIVDKQMDKDNTVKNIIEYRNILIDSLKTKDYEIIDCDEGVNQFGQSETLSAYINLYLVKDTDEYYIRIQFEKGVLNNANISISGKRKNIYSFPLSRDDLEFIIEYLGFKDGYDLLIDGYKNTEINPDNGSSLVENDDYIISVFEEVKGTVYYFDCVMGYKEK